jgi:hypothetical protein
LQQLVFKSFVDLALIRRGMAVNNMRNYPRFEPRSGQTKDYEIGICCFSAKHAALRRKNKDWFARNQNTMSKWSDMSTRELLFQWASTIQIKIKERVGLVQNGGHHHLIEYYLVLADLVDIAENCWIGVKQQSVTQSLFYT